MMVLVKNTCLTLSCRALEGQAVCIVSTAGAKHGGSPITGRRCTRAGVHTDVTCNPKGNAGWILHVGCRDLPPMEKQKQRSQTSNCGLSDKQRLIVPCKSAYTTPKS